MPISENIDSNGFDFRNMDWDQTFCGALYISYKRVSQSSSRLGPDGGNSERLFRTGYITGAYYTQLLTKLRTKNEEKRSVKLAIGVLFLPCLKIDEIG